MAGQTYVLGEQKVPPGIYVRVTNIGEPPVVTGAQGIGTALIKASWGPVGEVVTLAGLNEVSQRFGEGQGTEVLRELFRGGARQVKAVRVGSDGSKATLSLADTTATPVQVVTLETKYPTSRTFNITIRDTLADETQRELLVYEGTKLLETISFAKGTGEPQALTDAVNQISAYLTAQKIADGNGTLATVTNQDLTGGTDPTVTGESYTNAETLLEAENWNILVVDSVDPTVHATVQTFVNRMRNEGKRVLAVVGEPTSVNFDTRKTNSKAFDDPAIVYVGNGFATANGTVEGAEAAARVAGEILRSPYNSSLTHQVISGAVDIAGKLTNTQIVEAIQSGMLVFTQNANGLVQIEYGITTFLIPTTELDEGWKKIRRVRTRDELINRVVLSTDPLIGRINNDANGQATVISIINGVINQMIAEGGLLSGQAVLDETKPPQGDSAWFKIEADDLDSLEKSYFEFGFRFTPAS
jgi:hypothetical protein